MTKKEEKNVLAFTKESRQEKRVELEFQLRKNRDKKKEWVGIPVTKESRQEKRVSEFELQSRYYIHFQTNTLGKGMNPLIPQAMV